MHGDFNIHVDTTSNDSVKFLNCLELCDITHTPTHLHGHILDFVLTPTEPSVVANVQVGGLILDHAECLFSYNPHACQLFPI